MGFEHALDPQADALRVVTACKQIITDAVSDVLVYQGEASIGKPTSEKAWRIKRISVVGGVTTIAYPVGNKGLPTEEYEFVWNNRAELNYSLEPDTTAPTLTVCTISSDNTDPTKAKVGDTVTLLITASEALSEISALIKGHAVTLVDTGVNTYSATYTLTSDDTNGSVTLLINFKDYGGVAGVPVTTVTGGSMVTFDKSAPTAILEYSIDAGATYASTISVKDTSTLRIRATFNEALLDAPVVKLAIDNAILAATNMVKESPTVYHYDLNVPAGDVAVATCSLSVGKDLAGNVVTSAPTAGAIFTVDNTVPTMSGAVHNTDTQIEVTLSQVAQASSITKANAGGFVVTETGSATTYAVSAIAPGATNDKVLLTVANLAVSGKEGVTVTYTAGGNGTVQDMAGNALATDAVGVIVTPWDLVLPTLQSADRIANTTIRVTLSEIADIATITKANDGGFVVFETGTPATTYAVSAIAPNGGNHNQIDLTVADIVASALVGVTVTYVSGGNGTVADVAGNALATDAVGVVVAAW